MEIASTYSAIWDMDGTLVDTAELHFAAWSAVAKELNLPFSRADFAATFGKRNPDILRQLYNDRFSEKEIAALGERKEEYYRAAARRLGSHFAAHQAGLFLRCPGFDGRHPTRQTRSPGVLGGRPATENLTKPLHRG